MQRVLFSEFELVKQPIDYIRQLEWNDRMAVAASHKLSSLSSKSGNDHFDPSMMIYCFKYPEHIHSYWVKMLAKQKFPLLNELNRLIQNAIENGLVEKWLKSFKSLKGKTHQYNEVFGGEAFVVGYAIYSSMLLAAMLILIAERKLYPKVREANAARFWRYIEMYIDPNRHFLMHDLAYH